MATLERAIGPFSATLLVVGGIVGSGIFLTTGPMAAALPSASLLILAWTLGSLFALFGALTYAEMATMFPRSGGVYVFLREAFGPLTGFLYGWATLLVVLAGGTAAVAIGFANYFSYFFPSLSSAHVVADLPLGFTTLHIARSQLVAVAAIAFLGAINYVGVRSGSRTNAVLTIAKVTGLVLLPVFAIVSPQVSPEWTPIVPVAADTGVLAAFGVALISVLWAVEGYYFVTYAAGEVRDPARNLPRALAAGMLVVMAIYVIVNVSYLYALPMEALRGTPRVAETAATAMVGSWGATLIAATVLVSTLGSDAAVILSASRLFYAMAKDGVLFPAAAAVHPKYNTPHIAIIGLTIWSSVLAVSGTYEDLFTYVVFVSVLFSLLGGLAFFRLRQLRPDAERPYRVWGYPVVPAVFILGALFMVINTLVSRPVQSIAGLGLLVLGLPAYWYWSRQATTGNDR
ncbi:MAG TPA: amino acid permease [Vicinamibacterales bacterium]|nr:amino acid permease [Vicinamibacterales bacterium]